MNSLTTGAPRTLIVGLGRSGYSVARHLAACGEPFDVLEQNREQPNVKRLHALCPEAKVRHESLSDAAVAGYQKVILSPGAPRERIAASVKRPLGDIELFARKTAAPVLAITGSNGKSTVTALAGALLEAAGLDPVVAGNIGRPVLECLPPLGPPASLYVLELSSFQLETTYSLKPAAALLLNLSPDHLDRYADFAAYCAAKARIFNGARRIVLNRDDPPSQTYFERWPEAVSFGLDAPEHDRQFGLIEREGQLWLAHGPRPLLKADRLILPGRHNLANVLAAFALLAAGGIDLNEAVLCAATRFAGLPHRCEVVAGADGIRWINDSKATNVGATLAALAGLAGEQPLILIAGGRGKGADFAPLGLALRQGGVSDVILCGEAAGAMAAAIEQAGASQAPNLIRVDDLRAAVAEAARRAAPGQTVLFSPACSSFDAFENFERRGEAFKQQVSEAGQ